MRETGTLDDGLHLRLHGTLADEHQSGARQLCADGLKHVEHFPTALLDAEATDDSEKGFVIRQPE